MKRTDAVFASSNFVLKGEMLLKQLGVKLP
jgi:hypothetical protein